MAFRTHPQNPVFQSEGEKSVYGRLIDQLPDDAEVYCNVEHFDGRERREIDFLVALPEFGLVALEVKGGKVTIEGNSWMQWDSRTNKMEPKSFAYQLDAERRMLRDRFRQKFSRPYPTVAFLLVTPDSDFAVDAHTPGIERWQLVAKNEREQLYKKMLDAGVAREVARVVLPVSTYSSMYVSMNARALMNFLSLRTAREGSHFPSYPQREIEMVAELMEAEFAKLMPLTYAAFEKSGRIAP